MEEDKNILSDLPSKDKLHTDVLRSKYGKIHPIIIRHDSSANHTGKFGRIRETKLVDDNNILRTYAITFLTFDASNQNIIDVDEEIKQGNLIGETFISHHFYVRRNIIDVATIEMPPWLVKEFKTEQNKMMVRMLELYVKRGKEELSVYGTVVEIETSVSTDDHNSEYKSHAFLPPYSQLKNAGLTSDEIWNLLDSKSKKFNKKNKIFTKLKHAQKLNDDIIKMHRKKFISYLSTKIV